MMFQKLWMLTQELFRTIVCSVLYFFDLDCFGSGGFNEDRKPAIVILALK